MKYWVVEFDFDGIRLDDSDLTPYDFLSEIKYALQEVKADLILISQSYDEYHHIESCNLTYDGSPRILIRDMADGTIKQNDFIAIYNSYKYSFPKNALRMSWLEEKERSRTSDYFGEKLAKAAASILLTLEGVPFIMMGQEFSESTLDTWTSLFDEYTLNWDQFDADMFEHYKFLIHLRTNNPAFWKGELTFIHNSEELVVSYSRQYEGSKYLIVVNLSNHSLFVNFDQDTLADEFINDSENMIYRTSIDDRRSVNDSSNIWINSYETIIYRLSK